MQHLLSRRPVLCHENDGVVVAIVGLVLAAAGSIVVLASHKSVLDGSLRLLTAYVLAALVVYGGWRLQRSDLDHEALVAVFRSFLAGVGLTASLGAIVLVYQWLIGASLVDAMYLATTGVKLGAAGGLVTGLHSDPLGRRETGTSADQQGMGTGLYRERPDRDDEAVSPLVRPETRTVIRLLLGDGGRTTTDRLSEQLCESPVDAWQTGDEQSCEVALVHNHLPGLAETGLIGWDRQEGVVRIEWAALQDSVAKLQCLSDRMAGELTGHHAPPDTLLN